MPTALHPQAKFDPIPPDLDLYGLVDRTSNFRWVQRVSRDQIRNLGQQEFEKLVLIHVILGGKPLVISGWDGVLSKRLFNADWLEKTYDKKQENVRDITSASDIPMTTGHYLRSMKQLTNQWTPNNFRDERRQRLYLKDIDCPAEWHDALQRVIHPNLFYLNGNVSETGSPKNQDDDIFRDESTAAPAGDLMSSLPEEMRAQNLMCYIGHEGTYTPAHREMCASLGQNIMVEASSDENGEKPGSSIWFMTESKDREVVREYFLSMLGHDIEIEKHFAQINAWKKAPFDVYIVDQRAGDFILIPPLAAHQVWNRGTRTMKVAWNRTTAETLDMALHEALPKARLVCRDEQYKNKALVYFTLAKYHGQLLAMEKKAEMAQMSFMGLGQEIVRNSPRAKQLAADFKKLFRLFTEILVDEMFAYKEKELDFVPFDSCITCSYCRSNIFNRFLTCKHCTRTLLNGDEDAYDVCMECYAMGRSCACMSDLQWCEQWTWTELVQNYETWRTMVIKNDGFVDFEASPQPLEVARQRAGKKSVTQICQEALRRRPWKDITKPEREDTPPESEGEANDGKPKKKQKRKKKKGELRRCHVCAHKDYSYRVHQCTNPGCHEAYCYGVLYRAFDLMPQKVLEDEQWQCPKCMGVCNCGYCRRTGITSPYTPKNTSLGHDTRPIADDRSVEALVDFRVHNLSWLKAAGEESRSKNSRRMQRLREQADNAKAQGLTEQSEAERAMQSETQPYQNFNDGDFSQLDINGYGDQSHVLGSEDPSMPPFPVGGPVKEFPEDSPAPVGDGAFDNDAIASHDLDTSLYPDPSMASRQRIGMGYYEQDDNPDKILFDPYQAPTEEALRLSEPDVSEFVKKTIRAAKRKAKRDNEDPDFVMGKGHHKKLRPNSEPDYLDSMDPALFGGTTIGATPEAVMHEPDGSGQDQATNQPTEPSAQDQEKAPEKKKMAAPRFNANEPLLRHAKPLTSYVEMEDVEMEDLDMEDLEKNESHQHKEPAGPGIIAGAKAAVDLAADAVRSMFGQTSSDHQTRASESSVGSGPRVQKKRGRPPKHASTAAPQEASPSGSHVNGNATKRPRGRPRKSTLSQVLVDNGPGEGADDGLEPEAGPRSMDEHERTIDDLKAQLAQDMATENDDLIIKRDLKPRRGRPKKSGVTTIAAATPAANSEDTEPSTWNPSASARASRRGRPRRSEMVVETTAPAKSSGSGSTQLLSMADRMAMKGKKFRIGKRRQPNSTGASSASHHKYPANGTKPVAEDCDEVAEELQQVPPESMPKPETSEPSAASSTRQQNSSRSPLSIRPPRSGQPTVVRLVESESEAERPSEMSSSDSASSDEDIPVGRGVSSGRGKTRGRGRGRGRGRTS